MWKFRAVVLLLPAFASPTLATSLDDSYFSAIDRRADRFEVADIARLTADATAYGARSATLVLNVPWTAEGYLSDQEVQIQRAEILAAQQSVLALLPSQLANQARFSPYTATISVPFVESVLARILRENAAVRRVEIARPMGPMLSVVLDHSRSQGETIHARGATGSGMVVAVLDTGVNTIHESLVGKVVGEACYSTHGGAVSSLCPNFATASTATGSGADCDEATIANCGHGSRMAGVIAANGLMTGLAPDAGILAIKVFSNVSGQALFYNEDLWRGLNRVYELRNTYAIAAANMSLGGGVFAGVCDSVDSAVTQATANLRSVGIIPVASSGNGGNSQLGISWPACISHVISVGAVNRNNDVVESFSQGYSHLDLLAPIHLADSPGPTSANVNAGFTSGAAAVVSGAIAAMRPVYRGAGVSSLLNSLVATGVPLMDSKGLIKPRMRLDLALPPITMTATTWHCYGMTTVSWESIATATSYELQASPTSTTSWSPIYTGSSNSAVVDIWTTSKFRVRACNGSSCGDYHDTGVWAHYYSTCM